MNSLKAKAREKAKDRVKLTRLIIDELKNTRNPIETALLFRGHEQLVMRIWRSL